MYTVQVEELSCTCTLLCKLIETIKILKNVTTNFSIGFIIDSAWFIPLFHM